jgi:small subunit ribosomal protein S16
VAVKIRLKRMGKVHAPYYRIVVADSRTKRDGRAIEEIGKYHPTQQPSVIEVNSERAQYWLSVGAQPTEQVMALLKLTGDWGQFKGDKNAKSTVKTAEPKVPFSADAKKKPVLRPKAAKPEPEAAPAAAAPAAQAPESDAPAAEAVTDAPLEAAVEAPATEAPAAEETPVVDEAPAAEEAPAEEAPAAEEAVAEAAPAEEAPAAEETPVVDESPAAEEAAAEAPAEDAAEDAAETKPAG